MENFIYYLLKKFREYERYYMGDVHHPLEWRTEFLEFVLWLVDQIKQEQE